MVHQPSQSAGIQHTVCMQSKGLVACVGNVPFLTVCDRLRRISKRDNLRVQSKSDMLRGLLVKCGLIFALAYVITERLLLREKQQRRRETPHAKFPASSLARARLVRCCCHQNFADKSPQGAEKKKYSRAVSVGKRCRH